MHPTFHSFPHSVTCPCPPTVYYWSVIQCLPLNDLITSLPTSSSLVSRVQFQLNSHYSLPLSPLPFLQFIATSDREIYSQNTFLASLPSTPLNWFSSTSSSYLPLENWQRRSFLSSSPELKLFVVVVVSIRIWPHRIAWPPASIPDP